MKSNVSTLATSSCASSLPFRSPKSAHVGGIVPRHTVWITSTLNRGGASVPLYTHDDGDPSSKLNRYANHSVGWVIAGSLILNPSNSRLCDSTREAVLKPPASVGGTFAIVTLPSALPSPCHTKPLIPVIWMLSNAHHQSSLLW